MYGHKRYGKTIKPKELIVPTIDSTSPTFICSKCKQIRQLAPGYTELLLTVENRTKMVYKICWGCSVLLEEWIKK